MRRLAICLWIFIAFGSLLTVLGQADLYRARSELAQIHKRLGEFPISDMSKVHLTQITPPSPGTTAWRCYFPGRTTPLPTTSHIGQIIIRGHHATKRLIDPTCGWWLDESAQVQMVASMRWQKNETLHVSCGSVGGGTRRPIWNFTVIKLKRQLSDFLRQHRDKVVFEGEGEKQQLIADPNQPVFFCRVRVPKELVEQYVQEHGEPFRHEIEDIASFSLERWPPEQRSDTDNTESP